MHTMFQCKTPLLVTQVKRKVYLLYLPFYSRFKRSSTDREKKGNYGELIKKPSTDNGDIGLQ